MFYGNTSHKTNLRMLNERLLVLFVFLSLFFMDAYARRNKSNITRRVVGGFMADVKDYPFMVGIFFQRPYSSFPAAFLASFTLITTRTLSSIENLFGRIGNNNKYLGTKISFSKKIEHPKYIGRNVDHDIELLILQDDITDFHLCQPMPIPIPLPRELTEYSSGSATIVGWGDVEESQIEDEACLRAAYVDFVDHKGWTLEDEPIDDSVIITHKEDTSAMPDDSGGPIIRKR
ncbi:trypsin-1-like [Centruroides sculpturatus]|uniref:trypsin-1-like n=1 Tax=Centruroides sculpturatus TaxID=218467 RepID=UPI000C6CB1D5|nr:trypsin-1-like [Centruroides sculpturatus]